MLRLFILSIFSFLCISLSGDNVKYHKVPALPGDGVYSLLRRYKLDQFSCNHSLFYKINDLKKNTGLKVGRYYSIPVYLYEFNGKTIRSSIGIDEWKVAKNIEEYNQSMLKDGFKKYSYKENKILWVPNHLLKCNNEDIPAAKPESQAKNGEKNLSSSGGGSRVFPIFGKDYEHVPLESNLLRGKVFYIVGGHGGPDPGAVGKSGKHQLCEDEYAYDVALRLVRLLIKNGATAYMIVRDPNDGIRDSKFLDCDTDELVWGNEKIKRGQKDRLFQRSNVINELYKKHRKQGVDYQRVIAIHVDSRNRREQTDLFFYYHPDSPEGKKEALRLQETFRKKYKKHRRSGKYFGSVTGRDLHMLREPVVPAVYIELGNIRHPFDQQRIILTSNRKAIAQWIFEGLR